MAENDAQSDTLAPRQAHQAPPADGEVVTRLESDLDREGQPGRCVLEISRQSVRVIQPGDGSLLSIPLGQVRSARHRSLPGGGRLEITTSAGRRITALCYSSRRVEAFCEAARLLEQLCRSEPASGGMEAPATAHAGDGAESSPQEGSEPGKRWTLMRLLGYLQPYRSRAAFLVALHLFATTVYLAPPLLQGAIIDNVLEPRHDLWRLWVLMSLWVVVLGLQIVEHTVVGRLAASLGGHVAADLRSSVHRAIELLKLKTIEKKQVGGLVSRVTQDTERIWDFLVDDLPGLAADVLLILGIVVVLLLIHWQLTLCLLAPIPVVLAISSLAWGSISRHYERLGARWGRLHAYLNEALSGIRLTKIFVREDDEIRKFARRSGSLRDTGIAASSKAYSLSGVVLFFAGLGGLINWFVGGYLVYQGRLTLGEFWTINACIALVYGPLDGFCQNYVGLNQAVAGGARIFEIIDSEKEEYGPGEIRPIVGAVSFENVRFGYDPASPVLSDISFTVNAGETVGLVGRSGAGKSTIVRLLCRFYEPDSGCIRIDGADYRLLSLQDLRRQIGLVPAEPFLFSGTIAENIAYGQPDAPFGRIVEAAKAANAHQFILSRPDGYDTHVGEGGENLSSGERQRISIARATLHDPRLLILDEPTSCVDAETERLIQEGLGRLMKGRTTFAIAHRLSTLRQADRLIVLDAGRIVEMGTHRDLMDLGGVFHRLVRLQSQASRIIGVGG